MSRGIAPDDVLVAEGYANRSVLIATFRSCASATVLYADVLSTLPLMYLLFLPPSPPLQKTCLYQSRLYIFAALIHVPELTGQNPLGYHHFCGGVAEQDQRPCTQDVGTECPYEWIENTQTCRRLLYSLFVYASTAPSDLVLCHFPVELFGGLVIIQNINIRT